MITIRTAKGKYFFSSFVSLSEEKEAQIDESLLSLFDLKYLLTAIETNRLEASEEDIGILKATIAIRESGTGEGGVDPSVLLTKEDKINKVKVFGNGSDISYPTSLSLDTTKFTHVFTSSVEGETVFGTIKVPLTYEEFGYSLQQAINDFENNGFSLRFELILKSGSKRTVMVRTIGITQGAQQ